MNDPGLTVEEIKRIWSEYQLPEKGKGKGSSPSVSVEDMRTAQFHIKFLIDKLEADGELVTEAMAQLGEEEKRHEKEIERLKAQHALDVQKLVRDLRG